MEDQMQCNCDCPECDTVIRLSRAKQQEEINEVQMPLPMPLPIAIPQVHMSFPTPFHSPEAEDASMELRID